MLLKKRSSEGILSNQWELPSTAWKAKSIKFSRKETPFPNAHWEKTAINFKHSLAIWIFKTLLTTPGIIINAYQANSSKFEVG